MYAGCTALQIQIQMTERTTAHQLSTLYFPFPKPHLCKTALASDIAPAFFPIATTVASPDPIPPFIGVVLVSGLNILVATLCMS